MGSFLLTVNIANSSAQDLRLEITVPKTTISRQEPVNLTVRLVNTSSRAYYVSGDIAVGSAGFRHQFGSYGLEIRKRGAPGFVNPPRTFADPIGAKRNLSVAEFLVSNQLVLLEEGMFVGRRISSNWEGLTLQEPGHYSIRVTYSSSGDESLIPKELRFPIFRSAMTSNVIDLEIQP